MTLNQRLDLIKPKILQNNFRVGRGLANEINFWIFDYDADEEMAVRSHIDFLCQSINAEYNDVRIINLDLYKMMIEILEEKGYLDKIIDMENKKNSAAVINPIKKTLRVALDGDLIVNRISNSIESERDIIFLSGIGKAWPVVRTHAVLNNLHSKIDMTPVVMFFPGIYENELKLFSEITDDNYYRAFKLIER
jgi:hypothetical protein